MTMEQLEANIKPLLVGAANLCLQKEQELMNTIFHAQLERRRGSREVNF